MLIENKLKKKFLLYMVITLCVILMIGLLKHFCINEYFWGYSVPRNQIERIGINYKGKQIEVIHEQKEVDKWLKYLSNMKKDYSNHGISSEAEALNVGNESNIVIINVYLKNTKDFYAASLWKLQDNKKYEMLVNSRFRVPEKEFLKQIDQIISQSTQENIIY